ncbi:hypothetical protein E2C01_020060 [Portunus trituberculatus]|uniref:Uncharacterized protein n=1 Tax=Portunus trituberculatus TaxID=210409 RepID=A0A5B7E0H9_PORTR|nr:hypothetical protein [Portunus trituberculatus]
MDPSAYTGQGTADTVQEAPRLAQLERGKHWERCGRKRGKARYGKGRDEGRGEEQKLSGVARSCVWKGGNNGPAHPGLMVTAEDDSQVPDPPASIVGTGNPLVVTGGGLGDDT